jgi:AcrR family transcriptional regulator
MTALHLYATEGLDAVKLRQISLAADCANTAAVHYHFGSKLDLLTAIMAFLGEQIWRPALARLKDAINRKVDLGELLLVGLAPHKLPVLQVPWGGDAQGFQWNLSASRNETYRNLLHSKADEVDALLKRELRRRLSELPRQVFEQRWDFFMGEAVAGQWARLRVLRMPESKWSPAKERAYILRYLDYAIAGLTAPDTSSAELAALLKDLASAKRNTSAV